VKDASAAPLSTGGRPPRQGVSFAVPITVEVSAEWLGLMASRPKVALTSETVTELSSILLAGWIRIPSGIIVLAGRNLSMLLSTSSFVRLVDSSRSRDVRNGLSEALIVGALLQRIMPVYVSVSVSVLLLVSASDMMVMLDL
jgi:hypothetical protein